MQRSREALMALALGIGAILGCSKPAAESKDPAPAAATTQDPTSSIATTRGCTNPPAKMDGPEGAVCQFLEAMRAGDDQKTEALFTATARQRIQEEKIAVAPRGSDTVRFELGKAEYLADDGARVACKCSDLDADGEKHTDEMTVMVRKEADGWRVAGMALTVFDGEPPVLLNFEEPKEVQEKLGRVRQEIARRLAKEAEQPQRPEDSAPAVQR
jgi:hypothetical protein